MRVKDKKKHLFGRILNSDKVFFWQDNRCEKKERKSYYLYSYDFYNTVLHCSRINFR